MEKSLQYSCVDVEKEKLPELEYIIDNMEDISFTEFMSSINQSDFNHLISYLGYSELLPIEKDWSVRYFKCMTDAGMVYVFRQSAVEYVFS